MRMLLRGDVPRSGKSSTDQAVVFQAVFLCCLAAVGVAEALAARRTWALEASLGWCWPAHHSLWYWPDCWWAHALHLRRVGWCLHRGFRVRWWVEAASRLRLPGRWWMVEELEEGVWGAETRYGRSEARSVWLSIYIGSSQMQGERYYIPGAGAGVHSQGREATRRCRTLATSPTGGSC